MKDFEEEDFFSALLSTDFDTTDFDSFDSFDSSSDAFLRSSSESGGDDSPCLGVPLLCLDGVPAGYTPPVSVPFKYLDIPQQVRSQGLLGQGQGCIQSSICGRFKGATYFPRIMLWQANVVLSFDHGRTKNQLYLGTYLSEVSAAKARDCALLLFMERVEYGQVVSDSELNFSRETYSDLLVRLREEAQALPVNDFERLLKFLRRKLMSVFYHYM